MSINDTFIRKLQAITKIENIKLNEQMKNHTSFKIGGPADVLILMSSYDEISKVIKLCKSEEVPYYIMGNGSNLLISDKGIKGVVIKTYKSLDRISVERDFINCEAGVILSRLANEALENSLSGLEFASGIPGTVGGAVAMNAGAYDGEMKQVICETKYIDEDGNICTVSGDEHKFGYRTSVFLGTKKIILSTKLKLQFSDKQKIKEKMETLNKLRKEKQPLQMPSAGSVFKRPEGLFAGVLIEDSGLKGYKIGGAMVSDKHCGFIVNTGEATAQDVIDLINHIKLKVKEEQGVMLQTEIELLGEK